MNDQPCENTDRELWREREGDYYADSIHVTKKGAIGINCGGFVIVKPLREWHKLAVPTPATVSQSEPETNDIVPPSSASIATPATAESFENESQTDKP